MLMDRLAGNKRSFDTGGVGLRDSPEVSSGASAAPGLSAHTRRGSLGRPGSEESAVGQNAGGFDLSDTRKVHLRSLTEFQCIQRGIYHRVA